MKNSESVNFLQHQQKAFLFLKVWNGLPADSKTSLLLSLARRDFSEFLFVDRAARVYFVGSSKMVWLRFANLVATNTWGEG